ncbi:MAG: hypothetical protein EOM13_04030 [Clostridia bacterium]|nr:Flp1 family type IVb pilin [Eubacteriales bacterium]MDD3866913.1 Flp1 family type IVb pilin [Eubacteriales bacterium]NCC48203.1 hypothetical protein [Clostridia bacterium]
MDLHAKQSLIKHTVRCHSRKGIGTLEVVIIIAVLISVALIFREALTAYARQLIESVFGSQSAIADLIVTE